MGRNVARVAVSYTLFLDMITEGWSTRPYEMLRCTVGIPKNAVFVGSLFDEQTMTAYLILTHPSFAEVEEGQTIPTLTVAIQSTFIGA